LHADRDIVLPIPSVPLSICPSVCPSNAGIVSKLVDVLMWTLFQLFDPYCRYKIPKGTLQRVRWIHGGWKFFCIYRYLGNGTE